MSSPADSETGAEPKKSRAGRDLPAAIGVGVGLGAVIVASLFVYRPSFAVIVGLAVIYGCYELTRALGASGARVAVAPAELPIGVLTALLGGPFFLWLLLRTRIGEVPA